MDTGNCDEACAAGAPGASIGPARASARVAGQRVAEHAGADHARIAARPRGAGARLPDAVPGLRGLGAAAGRARAAGLRRRRGGGDRPAHRVRAPRGDVARGAVRLRARVPLELPDRHRHARCRRRRARHDGAVRPARHAGAALAGMAALQFLQQRDGVQLSVGLQQRHDFGIPHGAASGSCRVRQLRDGRCDGSASLRSLMPAFAAAATWVSLLRCSLYSCALGGP